MGLVRKRNIRSSRRKSCSFVTDMYCVYGINRSVFCLVICIVFQIPEWTEYGILRIVLCWNNFWFTWNSQIVLFIDLSLFTQRIKEKALKFHLRGCMP